MAGFTHIGLIEINKYVSDTLKLNRLDWNILCEDIENVATKDLENKVKFSFSEKNNKKLVLKDILLNVPKSECTKYSEEKTIIFKLVPLGAIGKI